MTMYDPDDPRCAMSDKHPDGCKHPRTDSTRHATYCLDCGENLSLMESPQP
jgi:hypothetical protein